MKSRVYLSADVQKTSETTVEVTRSFKAPKDLVFKAFTEPSLLKRWMLGTPGWEMPVCEIDLKAGGKYLWRWRNVSNGSEFGFFGVYREVKAPQTVSHTQTFDPGTLGGDMGRECVVTATFEETDGHTTAITKIEYQSGDDLGRALATGMTGGMEMSYRALDELVKNSQK